MYRVHIEAPGVSPDQQQYRIKCSQHVPISASVEYAEEGLHLRGYDDRVWVQRSASPQLENEKDAQHCAEPCLACDAVWRTIESIFS